MPCDHPDPKTATPREIRDLLASLAKGAHHDIMASSPVKFRRELPDNPTQQDRLQHHAFHVLVALLYGASCVATGLSSRRLEDVLIHQGLHHVACSGTLRHLIIEGCPGDPQTYDPESALTDWEGEGGAAA